MTNANSTKAVAARANGTIFPEFIIGFFLLSFRLRSGVVY
jgi:hypothetical protein